jgi:hypothetical protein
MRYFAPPTPLVLHSALDPDECERRLREAIDIERPTVFSLLGYRGSEPFLGKIKGRQIRILQRTYGRNAFPPVFSGEFQAQGPGTRITGTLDLELTSKIALCCLGAFGLLVLIPIVIYSRRSHPVLSVLFGCVFGSLMLFSPRIVRGSGLDQEKGIANFLRETLQADVDPSASAARTQRKP